MEDIRGTVQMGWLMTGLLGVLLWNANCSEQSIFRANDF